jgi:hypothetical protein
LLINDGSTDNSGRICDAYAKNDNRVRVIHQQNQKITATLNRGIQEASGELIARMDADDICEPHRFERQLRFLDAHPEVGVCGSYAKAFGPAGGGLWSHPTDDESIRCKLLFRNAFCHPTVMMRRTLFDKTGIRYDATNHPSQSQDYDLWARLLPYTRFANLPEILLHYRRHWGQITHTSNHDKLEVTAVQFIYRPQLQRMGFEPTERQLDLHTKAVFRTAPLSAEELKSVETWMLTLKEANRRGHFYQEEPFAKTLSDIWWPTCRSASRLGLSTFQSFRRSPLSSHLTLPRYKRVRFALKCALHIQ